MVQSDHHAGPRRPPDGLSYLRRVHTGVMQVTSVCFNPIHDQIDPACCSTLQHHPPASQQHLRTGGLSACCSLSLSFILRDQALRSGLQLVFVYKVRHRLTLQTATPGCLLIARMRPLLLGRSSLGNSVRERMLLQSSGRRGVHYPPFVDSRESSIASPV